VSRRAAQTAVRAPKPRGDVAGYPAGLREKLMAAVRPEFRRDDLTFDHQDPVFGGPACAVPGCVGQTRAKQLCSSHYERWNDAGRPELAAFAATTPPTRHCYGPLSACEVISCKFGRNRAGLCSSHALQWRRCGRPELAGWLASGVPSPVPSPLPATCRVGYCDLWVQGDRPLCLSHGKSLLARGYTDVDAFAHDWEHQPRGHEHIDLRRLPARLRLELQYVLQCRRDEATAKVGLQMVQRVVNALATDEITSLLERTEESYQQLLAPAKVSGGVTFLVAARRRIEQLAYGRGWSVEYPRDVWRLRNLESGTSTPAATIRFDRIPQAWLRDLAKRWARWRISSGISPTSTSSKSINAIARFAMFLARPEVGVGALADVDRAVIERYLADLHNELAGRKVHRDHIGGLSAFLVAIRQHRWDDTLPSSAMIFPEDYPKSMKLMPRALAEHVMAQLEDPANLDRWDDPVAG
jgi:hypothetical protein